MSRLAACHPYHNAYRLPKKTEADGHFCFPAQAQAGVGRMVARSNPLVGTLGMSIV